MTNSKLTSSIIFLALTFSFHVRAQDQEQLNEQDDKQQTIEEDEIISEQEQVEQKTKAITKDKIFIPTEEISEDKPVPFPVDI